MFSIYCASIPIYIPGESDFTVWDAKLTLGMNVSGSLSFSMRKSHPNYKILSLMEKEVFVRQDDSIIFRGRVLKMETTFENIVTVTCEGELSYLLDSIQPSRVYDGLTIAEFLNKMLEGENGHNEQVADDTTIDKTFYLKNYDSDTKTADSIDNIYYVAKYDVNNDGEINELDVDAAEAAEDQDLADEIEAYITGETAPKAFRRTVDMQNTFDIISDKILTPYGGMLSVFHETVNGEDKKYLKYQKTYKYTGAMITVGENLLDYNRNTEASDLVTQLIPLGADISDTKSLSSEFLRGKTWLALGDELTSGITLEDAFNGTNFKPGSVRHIADPYTHSDENAYTSNDKSYVNLLTEASHMKTVSMSSEGAEIFKLNLKVANGPLQYTFSPSITQMLLKEFGPATVRRKTRKDDVEDAGVTYTVEYKNGTEAVMNTDPLFTGKFRDYDFVTVFIGLNDWLMSNTILGTFEDAKKYAETNILSNSDMSAPYPSSTKYDDLINENTFTRPVIRDYISGIVNDDEYGSGMPYDEDKKPQKFKMTIYSQLFFLCRYMKACFPKSHIIFFTPLGARQYTESRYGYSNSNIHLGLSSNYRGSVTAGNASPNDFINKYTKDRYTPNLVTAPTKEESGTGAANAVGTFSPFYIHYTKVEGEYLKTKTQKPDSQERIDTEWDFIGNDPKKVYIYGDEEKKSLTDIIVTSNGLALVSSSDHNKVKLDTVLNIKSKSGDNTSEEKYKDGIRNHPTMSSYVSSYNSKDEDYDDNDEGNYVHTTHSIIRDPFGELKEMSFSIEDVRSAINEVCEEFDIMVVDTESEADISVNNYSKITKSGNTATIEHKEHDNLGSDGTKKGIWGESFYDGMHLNDLGQKKMAKVVRDAFIAALGESNEERKSEEEIEDEEKAYALDPNTDFYEDSKTEDDTSGASEYLTIRSSKASYMKCPAGDNTYYIYGKQLGDDGTGIVLKLKGKLTVNPVNNTEMFEPLDTEYGGITRTMQWDWIKDPDKLMKKGVQYLFAQQQKSVDSITCKAIDLSIIDGDYKQFKIGDKVLIYSPAHGINNETYILTDIDIDMQKPENTTYTFGNNSSSSLSTIGIGKNHTSATNVSLSSIEPWEGIING